MTFRVGLNKGLGLCLLCVGMLNVVTFAMVGSRMQLGLAAMMGAAAFMYLLGPAFVVEIEHAGNGVVYAKNPFGITLGTHPFARTDDLRVRGRKLTIQRTDGATKTVGGIGVDGRDLVRLADYLRSRAGR